MDRTAKDLTGTKFDRLIVIGLSHKASRNRRYWLCQCVCGNEKAIREDSLLGGSIKSCGCLAAEKARKNTAKHGMSRSRIYNVWQKMKMRCYNHKEKSFEHYGGRGISVCDEWKNSFQAFYDWAMSHGYEEHLTIDRIDVNGNYCPENCRWATMKEQQNNRRNNHIVIYNGRAQTIHQWADELNLNYNNLERNINKRNWDIEKAIQHKTKRK